MEDEPAATENTGDTAQDAPALPLFLLVPSGRLGTDQLASPAPASPACRGCRFGVPVTTRTGHAGAASLKTSVGSAAAEVLLCLAAGPDNHRRQKGSPSGCIRAARSSLQ